MKIAIIGGAGRMGRWLTQYFISHGHRIIISDIVLENARELEKLSNVEVASKNSEAVKSANLIIISTPLEIAPKVIEEVARHAIKGSVIIEICSIKSKVIQLMRKLADTGIRPLSIHPLFGPGAKDLENRRIAVIPLVDSKVEIRLARDLFPEAKLVTIEADEHDRCMAVTLSLVYFINSVFSWVISEKDLLFLKELEGTTFKMQMVLAESIMSEEPSLNASIQIENRYTLDLIDNFLSKAIRLKTLILERNSNDFSAIHESIESVLHQDPDFSKAYKRMYKLLDIL
jgi:prephenate dehydrogenase